MIKIQPIPTSPCLSSELANALKITSGNESVEVKIFHGTKPIFQTTLFIYSSETSFTSIREIIEEYMRTNNLITGIFSINFTSEQEQATTGDITIIYSTYKQQLDSTFFKTHFLTTRTSFLVPYEATQNLTWFEEETPDDNLFYEDLFFKTEIGYSNFRLMERSDNSSLVSETISPKAMVERLKKGDSLFSKYRKTKLCYINIHRGNRSITLYIIYNNPQLSLNFRNCFNCQETAHIFAVTNLKTDIDRSEATYNNQTSFYDQQTTKSHEVQLTALSIEHALWLNQLMESHEVTDLKGNSVLVSDITSEISDETNVTNHLKFSWRYADNSLTLK